MRPDLWVDLKGLKGEKGRLEVVCRNRSLCIYNPWKEGMGMSHFTTSTFGRFTKVEVSSIH